MTDCARGHRILCSGSFSEASSCAFLNLRLDRFVLDRLFGWQGRLRKPHIRASWRHGRERRNDGDDDVYCWGDGYVGELGNGLDTMWDDPQQVPGLKAKQIAAGLGLTCAVNDSDQAVCWGSIAYPAYDANTGNLLDEPRVQALPTPTRVLSGLGAVVQVTVGGETACRFPDHRVCDAYVCGVSATGDLSCEGWWPGVDTASVPTWRANGTTPFAELSAQQNVLSAAAGDEHVCVLAGSGLPSKAFCWGKMLQHVGRDSVPGVSSWNIGQVAEPLPYPLEFFDPPMKDSISLSAGKEHTCAVAEHGYVNCWGTGTDLGNGFRTLPQPISYMAYRPVPVSNVSDAVQISAGYKHTCVSRGSRISCWGENAFGQLGDGSKNRRREPVMVPNRIRFVQVAAGSNHTCAIERPEGSGLDVRTGSVVCWGDDSYGQLGDNEWQPVTVKALSAP